MTAEALQPRIPNGSISAKILAILLTVGVIALACGSGC
jgi:hypothetical protein